MAYRVKSPDLHLEAHCIKAIAPCTSSAFYDFSTLCMEPTSSAYQLTQQRHPHLLHTRVGTLIVATIYLQLIQNRYMFRSFTVLKFSHPHCVQPVASDVEVVGYL